MNLTASEALFVFIFIPNTSEIYILMMLIMNTRRKTDFRKSQSASKEFKRRVSDPLRDQKKTLICIAGSGATESQLMAQSGSRLSHSCRFFEAVNSFRAQTLHGTFPHGTAGQ